MSNHKKSKEELIKEINKLQKEFSALDTSFKNYKKESKLSGATFNNNEDQFSISLESMKEGFVALDKNWIYTYVNKNAAKMFGRKPEDLVGKHIWTEFPEGINQPFYKNYYKAVKTQQQIYFEEYYEPWNRWYENRVIPSKNGLSIYFQDITEHKLAKEALKISNAQLNTLVNSTKDVIMFSVDKNYNYTAFNKKHKDEMQLVFDASIETGQNMLDFINKPEVKKRFKKNFKRVLSGERFEEVRELPDLNVIYNFNWNPIKIKSGEIVGISCMLIDITSRKNKEKTLNNYLDSMDIINNTIHDALNLDEAMNGILKAVLDVLNVDRAWLLNPCDPDSETWKIAYEITNPEYPGVFELGKELKITPKEAELFRKMQISKSVETLDFTKEGIDYKVSKEFRILNQMQLTIHVPDAKPWLFGIHQCSNYREWTREDKHLFKEIGRRLSDKLRFSLFYQELKESEKRFRYVLENSIAVLYNYDLLKFSYDYLSPSTKEVFGFPTEYFVKGGREAFYSQIHPEDLEEMKRYLESVFSNETDKIKTNCEYRIKHPKLGYRWINDNRKVIEDSNEKPISIIGSANDVTEQKIAEIALNESESKFRKIIDGLPFPVCYVIEEGEMNFRNKRFLEVFGYTEEDVPNLDMWWEKAYPNKKYRNWVIQNWNKSVHNANEKGIDIKSDEYKVTCKDGKVRDIIISGITINKDFLATFIDITERNKSLVEIVKAKDRAEESDRLKSAFLANMSHEIRTPMNGILGFTDLLKEKDLSGEQQEKYISVIERSGVRMLNIINDLIDISKIESGQMELKLSKTNINDQLDYIYSLFKLEAKNKSIKLSYKAPLSKNDAVIYSDKEKIYAILTNLIKNSIKYSESDTIEFGYNLKDNFIQFYVKDFGVGIEPDRIDAIFERFVQADIEDVKAYQGAGLGLSISKAYVEMLGGKIWVKSELGKGSIFYFKLPRNSQTINNQIENKQLNKKNKEKEKSMKKLKVLIVEDDDPSTMYLKIALKPLSKEIFEAKTGEHAIEVFKNNSDIDLILMDIKLPNLSGYDVTKQIREYNKDVIIIAQTAYGLYGDREKSIDAGCNDYISKPINKEKLNKLITKYF